MNIRICTDEEECEHLWKKHWPEERIFDKWSIRHAFLKAYKNSPYFLVVENNKKSHGFLALCELSDGQFMFFPGETWKNRTWLENNRIPVKDQFAMDYIWEEMPANTVLHYLNPDLKETLPCNDDETGYFFLPQLFGYDYDRYFNSFSKKTGKKIAKEVEKLGEIEYHYMENNAKAINWMLETNIEKFGDYSYFSNANFINGFENMISILSAENLLRTTILTIKGEIAAVDVGAVFNNNYTVFAGAVSREFPGIAKAINLFHMRKACEERFGYIDFLCGDFGWKEKFLLTPKQYYTLSKTESCGVRLAAGE